MLVSDDSHFPIVFVRASGTVDEADGTTYGELTRRWTRKAEAAGGRYYLVADARDVDAVDSLARKAIVDSETELTDEEFERMGSRIVVANSKIVRGAITAMSWFTSRMKNVVTASEPEGALRSLRVVLAQEGVAMPPGVESLVRGQAGSAVG